MRAGGLSSPCTSTEVSQWWAGLCRRYANLGWEWFVGVTGPVALLTISTVRAGFCCFLLCLELCSLKTTSSPDLDVLAPQICLSWPSPHATPSASSTWWMGSCPASCTSGRGTWAWVCPSTLPATPCSPTWSHTSRTWRWAALGGVERGTSLEHWAVRSCHVGELMAENSSSL